MRRIAGTLKGRRLKAAAWDGLRPTSDKLRETLFNILAPRTMAARVLDGYAGTGALGIEALSRGASHVTFIDEDARATALISENLAHCRVENGYAIIRAGFTRALSALPIDTRFDVMLVDPPYDLQDPASVVAAAGQRLAREGVLVFEHARRTLTPASGGDVVRVRELTSGDSALSFYEWAR